MGIEGRHIHLSDYAQQPEVRIACTQRYSSPWNQPKDLPPGVHQLDEDLYTFDEDLVTCPECKAMPVWVKGYTRKRRFEAQLQLWGLTGGEYVAATRADPFLTKFSRASDEELDRIWKGET